MQKAIVRRTFDVVRNQRQEPIYAAKGDYGARYIQAIITADGVPYAIPENAIVTINAFRRDGKTNRFKGEVNADGSVIVPITQWMLEILGMVDCTISVVEEGGMLTTENFYVVANESSTNVEVSPDDPQYDLLTEVLLNEGTRQKQFSDMVEYINSLEQGKQGPVGPAGIHIGAEPPTDGQSAWIDTNEEPSAEEGGANFDIVAKPGQVIAVKAVDVEGKPKEYKAVDLPVHDAPDWNAAEGAAGHVKNRTHYVDEKGVIHKLPNKFIDADWMATKKDGGAGETVFIPEQTVTNLWRNLKADLVEGDTYAVEVNSVLYKCKCLNDGDGTLYLGNGTLLGATEGNSEPFAIAWLTGTGGMFYSDGTLETPIGIKVSDWVDDEYNTLPKEYMPEISWDELTDRPLAKDVGELLFAQTVTFDTDAAATTGTRVLANGLTLTEGAEYWLEINGDMIKCHCESSSAAGWTLYDTDNNLRLKRSVGYIYINEQTAGTYSYNLYDLAEKIVIDPNYIPSNIARKSDIPEGGTGGGSASIDVTAQVGQTIVVKEVDASGKPTKWESADYQPRTHYQGIVELYNATLTGLAESEVLIEGFSMQAGETYYITWNGVEYTCVCVEVPDTGGMCYIGTGSALGLEDTGEPFVIMYVTEDGVNFFSIAASADGVDEATVLIKGTGYITIPDEYVNYAPAFPYYIEVTGSGTTDDPYTCAETVAQIASMLDSGREIKARRTYDINNGGGYETDIYNLATTMKGHIQLLFVYQTISKRVLIFAANEGGGYDITDSLD